MRRQTNPSLSCLAAGLLLVLAGCGKPQPSAGSAHLSVSLPASLSSPQLSRVTVTLSAPDLPARSEDLALVDGQWKGTLGAIPSGHQRSFSAEAFDTSGVKRFAGQVSGITIAPGATAAVALLLQEVGEPPSRDNAVPGVQALLASAARTWPGGSLSLEVRAQDPDPTDRLFYSWTATAGSFAFPTRASTSWTAPQDEGPVTVTITVTDSRGASASHSLTLLVGTYPPQVVATRQSSLQSSDSVSLYVAAWEPQGGSLAFSWSSDRGRLGTPASEPTASEILWFPPSCLPEGALPVVSVTLRNTFGLSASASFPIPDPLPTCTPGTWAPATSLSAPRFQHTATRLASGQVLVAGGLHRDHNAPESPSAEVYDPATGSWSPTGSMLVRRQHHTATLLPSGQVLVTGGLLDSLTYLSSCELYDPATKAWSGTSSLSSARSGHVAVLLPTGKVLVAGGSLDASTPLTTAALYDPTLGTWSPTGAMSSARTGATATLLPSGQVLVVGGTNAQLQAQASAELYDPSTGTWTPTAAPSAARAWHAATPLPSGRVLVTGGTPSTSTPGPTPQLASAELYDASTHTWLPTSPLASERSGHTATLLPASERVLVTGGRDANGSLATAELYDIASGTWSPAPALSTPRFEGTATALAADSVLLVGGRRYSFAEPSHDELTTSQATTERYAP